MDLAAFADPDESEEQRARLRATADRDASALVASLEPAEETPVRNEADVSSEADAPTEPVAPDPPATYREVFDFTPLRLGFPFEIDGVDVSSVSMVPPTFADVEAFTAGRISEIEMFARMCGLPVAALRAMRWPDVELVTLMARHLAPQTARR